MCRKRDATECHCRNENDRHSSLPAVVYDATQARLCNIPTPAQCQMTKACTTANQQHVTKFNNVYTTTWMVHYFIHETDNK